MQETLDNPQALPSVADRLARRRAIGSQPAYDQLGNSTGSFEASVPAAAAPTNPLAAMFPGTAAVLSEAGGDARRAFDAGKTGVGVGHVARGALAAGVAGLDDAFVRSQSPSSGVRTGVANVVHTTLTGSDEPYGGAGPVAARAAQSTQPFEAGFPASSSATTASEPSLAGQSGAAVSGAPGVSRFVQNGRSLYSNVTTPGANDAFMSSGPVSARNQAAIAGIQSRQDASDQATANKAQYDKEVAEAAATNAQGGFGTGQVSPDPRALALAQLSKGRLTKSGLAALSDIDRNDLARRQQEIAGSKALIDNQASVQQVALNQQMQVARAAMVAAKTPAERQVAEDNLRALQAHYEKNFPTKFTVVPGGQSVDPATGAVVREPSRVINNDTGEFVNQPDAKGHNAPPQAISMLKANPALAADFDKKNYGITAAQVLGQK